ncbi:MAG: ATP-binding protein, partial [Prevotella sp.]|nr:ATP-binding protein [Prevotella sp.]
SIGWSKELSNEVEAIIECPNDNLLLNIDSTHFAHIVDILSANSALFCKVGTIRARCEYIIDKLHVTFQDTGVGIDEESMKHLFDRSVDTDNIEQGRTKIGLVICKSLIEQLGGELSISSELDMGTTIRFNIPCTKVGIEEMAEPALFKD